MSRLDAVTYISHGVGKGDTAAAPAETKADETKQEEGKKKPESALKQFTVNLNEKAEEGRVDPLIGRGPEVDRTIQILCRRPKNNPLYVGDPGVGKTVDRRRACPQDRRGRRPRRAEARGHLLARHGRAARGHPLSRRFRGAAEGGGERARKAPHAILFIDEIHTVIGAGATSGGAMDASNLLKPALSNGAIRCIGSTTYKEFRNHFEKDRALLRRFQKIDVNEPTVEDTIKILAGLSRRSSCTTASIHARRDQGAVELSARYINDRKLPTRRST